MVLESIPTGYELRFLVDIGIALAAGFAIGVERESKGKPAGIGRIMRCRCRDAQRARCVGDERTAKRAE